ncbi:hypothetical protein QJS10_CPB19g00882 [Acorus calamus]|uniref:Uncharacterized protein n=1 Tax=Acorus calamus TaxID=4465 RepID=A0AAV9CID4_ACOCL|nr:hypothetical protein QJS10_CPB19g00882 [Acorus calamus]
MGRRVSRGSKSTAVSATPVKPGKTYPLSILDHSMGLHTLRLVFYYKPMTTTSGPIDRERLKESLSDCLSHYPAVTGRLFRSEEGNWIVKCNDAGVRLMDATVDATVDEWLETVGGDEEVERMTYWEDPLEDVSVWSPFYIQFNKFNDGGLAIGLSCPHMHVDPTCATLIIKAWSDCHRLAPIIHPPFFHPPALIPRPNPNLSTASAAFYDSKSKHPNPLNNTTPPPMSTATFRFSDASVKKLLSELTPHCPDATPFDALAALFWTSVARASGEEARARALSVCIDFRKLMHAPLPHGFFGNALHFSRVSVETEGEEGEGAGALARAAQAVRAHVSGLEEEEYWSAVEWLGTVRRDGKGRLMEPFAMYGGEELTCASFDHMFSYGACFERDAKPAHVSYRVGGVGGEGMIMVLPSPEEGLGRTVTVTLPKDRTEAVRADKAVLRFEPTMVASGRGFDV